MSEQVSERERKGEICFLYRFLVYILLLSFHLMGKMDFFILSGINITSKYTNKPKKKNILYQTSIGDVRQPEGSTIGFVKLFDCRKFKG